MTTWTINILKSPGKFDLAVAFFNETPAHFTVSGSSLPQGKHVINVNLKQLRHEGWKVRGFSFEGHAAIPLRHDPCGIKGHFNIRTGKGWIEYETE